MEIHSRSVYRGLGCILLGGAWPFALFLTCKLAGDLYWNGPQGLSTYEALMVLGPWSLVGLGFKLALTSDRHFHIDRLDHTILVRTYPLSLGTRRIPLSSLKWVSLTKHTRHKTTRARGLAEEFRHIEGTTRVTLYSVSIVTESDSVDVDFHTEGEYRNALGQACAIANALSLPNIRYESQYDGKEDARPENIQVSDGLSFFNPVQPRRVGLALVHLLMSASLLGFTFHLGRTEHRARRPLADEWRVLAPFQLLGRYRLSVDGFGDFYEEDLHELKFTPDGTRLEARSFDYPIGNAYLETPRASRMVVWDLDRGIVAQRSVVTDAIPPVRVVKQGNGAATLTVAVLLAESPHPILVRGSICAANRPLGGCILRMAVSTSGDRLAVLRAHSVSVVDIATQHTVDLHPPHEIQNFEPTLAVSTHFVAFVAQESVGVLHVNVFDAKSGNGIRMPVSSKWPAMAFSADGQSLAFVDAQKLVVWNSRTGRIERPLGTARIRIKALAWSKDGMRIAAWGDDHVIRVWNLR